MKALSGLELSAKCRQFKLRRPNFRFHDTDRPNKRRNASYQLIHPLNQDSAHKALVARRDSQRTENVRDLLLQRVAYTGGRGDYSHRGGAVRMQVANNPLCGCYTHKGDRGITLMEIRGRGQSVRVMRG